MANTRLTSVKLATPSIKVSFVVKQPACAATITITLTAAMLQL
jgi:hypothetical protein